MGWTPDGMGMEHLFWGSLGAQESPGMPSEVPGEAVEPSRSHRQQHGKGEWYLHRALRRPGERSKEEKLQFCHSSFPGILKKKSLWGRGSAFTQSCT